MGIVYVAYSAELGKWASDVGLSKHVYMVGVAEDAETLDESLTEKPCGMADWAVLTKAEVDGAYEDQIFGRLAGKEKAVDPNFYPRLRGRKGVFKVKIENVENHILVKKALDGIEVKDIKVKSPDIAAYLLHNATK